MGNIVITGGTDSDTLKLLPKDFAPPKNEAEIHVSCNHPPDKACDIVKSKLEKKFEQYEPEFEDMPANKRIRSDESTLIKLKNVTPDLLTSITDQTSEVTCVLKVRTILKN